MKELKVRLTFVTPLLGYEGETGAINTCRFSRRDDGAPIIHSYEIRKFFEEGIKRIRIERGLPIGSAVAPLRVGFEPKKIPVALVEPVRTEVRSLRNKTPYFEHELSVVVEVIPAWSTCEFSIFCFYDVDEIAVRRCLDLGASVGLSHHWGGNGQFLWEEIY